MTSPSDLVALVARLRELAPSAVLVDMGGSGVCHAAADAIEQLQAELADCHRAITIWDASDLKARPAVEQYARAERAETEAESLRAELATALEDASELRALDNEAQHGADALRAELESANSESDHLSAELEAIRDKLVSIELLESLAAVEHNRWAGWMRYQETASAERRADWPRKAALAYTQLTHDEQESDREEVRTTLAVIEDSLNAAVRAAHAQAGDGLPPDNWHEPADGRRLAEHNKGK